MSQKGLLSFLGIGGGSRSTALPVGSDIKNTLPDATYLESVQKALQGDVASTLSGGEKLAALGALLKSASRGSQVSPQAVMASVQQTAQNRAATQLQLAQLQAAMNERAKFKTAAEAHAKTITDPDKQRAFLALPDEIQAKRMYEFTKDATPFQLKESNGKSFMVMSDKSVVELTGLPEDIKTEWKKYDYNGDGIEEEVQINSRTGEPILNANQQALVLSPGMSPAQKDASIRGWAQHGLQVKKFIRGDGAGENNGGKLPEPKEVIIDGQRVMAQWDKKNQRYVPYGAQNVAKPASGYRPVVPVAVGKPLFGNR